MHISRPRAALVHLKRESPIQISSAQQAMAAAAPSADRDEATAAVADEGWNLPTDVFVEILLLLPATDRKSTRLNSSH